MSRVTVSGYYGFGNTGDEAIALSISQQLRAAGHTPLLLSNTPTKTADLYGCESAARMHPLALARAISGCDLLLSGGGGLLQDKTSARTLTYYLGIIRLARALGKKVVIFNQSVGPLSSAGEKKVAAALRGLRVIVRDRASLELVERLGLTGELGGDPALLLSPTAGVASDPQRVVVAPRGDVETALPALRQAVAHWQAQGKEVMALSFYPHEDDEAARSLNADRLVSTTDPQVALDTIAEAGYVVGVRLHAVILAAAAGIPFCGVAYDPKVSGFCADAGAPFHGVTPELSALLAQVDGRQPANPEAIAEMKRRAGQSFVGL